MISCEKLTNDGRGNIFDYLMADMTTTNYYFNKEGQDFQRWGGKLASDPDIDLLGKPVDIKTMTMLGEGYSPSGMALCKNAGEKAKAVLKFKANGEPVINEKTGEQEVLYKGGHVIGYDYTISAPKDISTLFAMADPEEQGRILNVHRKGVQAVMDMVESLVETRTGEGGKTVIKGEGILYSLHEHFTSRNNDPLLHTHPLIYSKTKGGDGKWRTFDGKFLFEYRKSLDEVYKMTMYPLMRELGYNLEQVKELNDYGKETGKVITRVQGVPEEIVERFSSRRKELLEYAKENGVDNQTACLATRANKDEPPLEEMLEIWKDIIKNEFDPSIVKTIEEIKATNSINENYKKATNEEILERLHLNNAIFTEKDLMRELAMENSSHHSVDELPALIAKFKKEMNLVEVRPEGIADEDKGETLARRNTEMRYAAPWMVNVENRIRGIAEQRATETKHHVPEEIIKEEVEKFEKRVGYTLTQEQNDNIRHACNGTGGLAVARGWAGSGKTATVSITISCYERMGFTCKGVAVSNIAAQKLEEESTMKSSSVQQLLADYKKGKVDFKETDIVVLDEAGMADSKDTLALIKIVSDAGGKLLLQGDTEQLQPIGAGSGMKLVEETIGASTLKEIRRQKEEPFRDIAYLFYGKNGVEDELRRARNEAQSRSDVVGKGKTIFDAIVAVGALDEWNTKTQCVKALVGEYLESKAPMKERLALAHSRAEVYSINDEIRIGLRKQGLIGEKEAVITTRQGDSKVELGFSKGDLIRFNTKDNNLGVVNGTQGVLEDIHKSRKGGFNFTVRKADGKKVKFNTHDFNALSHDYCMTVHKSQGQGKTDVFHLANTGMMDNQSSLVAFTRLTKGKYRLFATTDEVETLHERFGMERLKENATTNPNPPTKKEKVMKDLENWLDTAGDKDTQFLNQVEVMVQAKKKAFKPKNVEVATAIEQPALKTPVEPVVKDKPSQSQFRR